jgi:hypothetical protein
MHTNQLNAVPHSKYESGQAIVIIALMLVGLIGFLGLAVDGGGMFLLYRNVQSATDAAVVAASYALCTDGDPVAAAYAAAELNGYKNDAADPNTLVTVNNPPLNGEKAGDDDYVEITISAVKPAYFIQLVYKGPLRVTNRAVGYCIPPRNPYTIAGLWAGSTTCQNGIKWGGSDSEIHSDIHSNHEVLIGGGGGGNEVYGDVTAVTLVDGPNTEYYTDDDPPVANTPQTGTEYLQEQDPLGYRISDFAPGSDFARRAGANYHVISATSSPPSGMGSWSSAGGGEWRLGSNNVGIQGVFYVEGNVDLGNGFSSGANGISIISTGKISGSGGATMRYALDGILFFTSAVSPCPSSTMINVSGSGNSWFGVIYAPYAGVNVSGSNHTIHGGIFADTIEIQGSELDFWYDPSMIPPRPPSVTIAE